MSTMLFHAHSGLRYLVLLAALVALILLVHGRMKRRPYGGPARTSGAIFVGLLDLQLVLGLVLLALWPWYPALIGHIVMMVLAVAAAHVARVYVNKATSEESRYTRAIVSVAVPLVLIVGGILAIGRGVI